MTKNNIYHKGKYRNGEWAKHLRPYLKKQGNKKWRKAGKLTMLEDQELKQRKYKLSDKLIKVKITKEYFGGIQTSEIKRYRSLKDARNAIRRSSVISAFIYADCSTKTN